MQLPLCMLNTKLFIDFDSTFNQVESLEALLQFSIPLEEDRKPVLTQIEELTNLAMEGKIDYKDSLNQRIALLRANKEHLQALISYLNTTISPSIVRNKQYLIEHKEQIFIISNGFEDFITPVITEFGLLSSQVFANRFLYDTQGTIIGVDQDNPLAKGGGKPVVINRLDIPKPKVIIGDGYNDYEAKAQGAVDQFILFTENITRKSVVPLADQIVNNFEEIIELFDV